MERYNPRILPSREEKVKNASEVLDELMGLNRDGGQAKDNLSWDSPDVCKHFLVDFCLNQELHYIFNALDCRKIHKEELKSQFQAAPFSKKKLKMEKSFLNECTSVLDRFQKKVRIGKWLSLKKFTEMVRNEGISAEDQERIEVEFWLQRDDISALLVAAEYEANQDNLPKARELTQQAHVKTFELKKVAMKFGKFTKFLDICEMCGQKYVIGAIHAKRNHFEGRIHNGFLKVNASVERIKEEIKVRGLMSDEANVSKRYPRRSRSRSRSPRPRTERKDRPYRSRDGRH